MKNRFSVNTLVVIALNIIIALGFFIEHKDSGYSSLASDLHSIIPIGQKFDNPELFKDDLFLNTLDNVKYYTPFFVQPLRLFAKISNGDYLQGLNLFGAIAHLLYGILWYLLLFKFTRNFWVALIVSIIIRGIVWLPGYEIWGITDIWSIMPRTIYITLMPLPFLLLSSTNRMALIASGFLIGLVFNFHPITGLGGILIFLSLIAAYYYFFRDKISIPLKTIALVLLAIFLGMLPFIITYFTKTESGANYDVKLYKEAFLKRIPAHFENPLSYLKQWLKLKTLFFLLPMTVFFIYAARKSKLEFKKAKILVFIIMALFLFSSLSVYVESAINSYFKLNIRMAFQFIRLQKLAILPVYFAIAFLLIKSVNNKRITVGLFIVLVMSLTVAKSSIFDKVPLIGDDIFRSILPNTLSIVKDGKEYYTDTDLMMKYIAENTNEKDVFYGPPVIRCSAQRSVILDMKGASAIIEGNPAQFINWYKDYSELEKTYYPERVDFLKQKKANYIVTSRYIDDKVKLIHETKTLKLYKIE